MRSDEYDRIFALEETHWWYQGLHALVLALLRRYPPIGCGTEGWGGGRERILDVGCGTGGMAAAIARFATVTGVEISERALEYCRQRGLERLVAGSVEALPFADRSFDAVVSLDVLYHAAVTDDHHAVGELARVLRPGGVLIVNLPAYNWVRGSHDLVIHTARRYTRTGVHRLFRAAGLVVAWSSYWNTLLFPIAVVARLGGRITGRGQEPRSDLGPVAPTLNQVLASVLAFERRLLRVTALPFGLSVLAVGRRSARGPG